MVDEREIITKGFVYILEVKDIVLPVCKIGMTSRDPSVRCAEINMSSTGDFIWDVAFKIPVDNCQILESLVHKKLSPLRQKGREFFNINADDAYQAIQSILAAQSDVKVVAIEDIVILKNDTPKTAKSRTKRKLQHRKIDTTYAEILQAFTSIIGIKGRPFGQLNEPIFGMSDGYEGVQWNIAVSTDTQEVRMGVNLEGKEYSGWPISTFIQSELANPSIHELMSNIEHPELLHVRFTRDAWQVLSRPKIEEQYIGGGEISMSDMNSDIWTSTLKEALSCLKKEKRYRGRNKQTVTLVNQPKKGERVRIMWVSPHLTVWTPIDINSNITSNLEAGFTRLKPVYQWISMLCQ